MPASRGRILTSDLSRLWVGRVEKYSTPAAPRVCCDADSGNFSRGGGTGSTYNEYTGGCLHWPCGYRATDWKTRRKIDYIFLSRYDFTGFSADASYALHPDHVPLWATAVIT